MEQQRLDKVLAGQGTSSRREVKEWIRKGLVKVNGQVVRAADAKILPTDRLEVNGREVDRREHLYLMLNKPLGVVSASRDDRDTTVVELVPEELRRKNLFPAGRLDKDTSGFVLITDDGAFAHDILSPRRHVEKEYLVRLDRPLTQEMVRRFAEGMTIGEDRCRPARLLPEADPLEGRVILQEGMYHQIRRMFAACGATVTALKRIRMGGLSLDPALRPGECRELTPGEVEQIKAGRRPE